MGKLLSKFRISYQIGLIGAFAVLGFAAVGGVYAFKTFEQSRLQTQAQKADQLSILAGAISKGVQEAASSSEQVTGNIQSVVTAAAETGTSATTVLGAAQELSRHAARLKRDIDSFIGSDAA